MNNNYGNNDDMQRLQQEAIRRVREMQSRAKVNIDNTNKEVNHSVPQNNDKKKPSRTKDPLKDAHYILPTEPKPSNKQRNIHKEEPVIPKQKQSSSLDFMGSIMKDKDRTLILVLILILSGEDADLSLILALLYLMM